MDSQTNVVIKEQANKRTQCKAALAPHAELQTQQVNLKIILS